MNPSMNRFSLPYLMGAIASIPKRFAATAASALCMLMLAVPTWGQVVTISPETITVQEEDEDEIIFTVMADSDPSKRLIVGYTVSGTASAGADYTAFTTTEVVFTGTDTAVEVTIEIIDDLADEGDTDETIIVTLDTLIGGDTPSLGAGTTTVATVNIDDDDAAADIDHIAITNARKEALAKLAVDEGGDAATYMVALSKKPTADVTLEIAVAGEDEENGDDEENGEDEEEKKEKLTISPNKLTFTDKNWDKGQAVAVSAALDEDDVDETVMVSHKPTGKDFEDDVEASMFPVEIIDQGNPRLVAVRLSEKSSTVSPQEDTYGVGEKILLDVEFTKPVKVTGTPQLKVLVGDTKEDLFAEYMPPEDEEEASAVITFAYTVQADDEDDDGIGVPTANPLMLDGDDAIVDAKDDDVAALTEAAEGAFTVTIAADVTKVDGGKDFQLRAHAGEDQNADEDKVIELDGSGTTTGEASANLRYVWKFKGSKDDAPDWLSIADDVTLTLEGEDDEEDEELVTPAGDVVNFGEDEDDDLSLEGETVSFSAAMSLEEEITLTFELIVTNTRTKETSKDEVVVKISADDDAPVAVPTANGIGSSIQVEEGTAVLLDGSGSSDPEGKGIASYAWRLKSGDDGNPPYIKQMQGFDSALAAVELRTNITGGPTLTFELTVTDAGGTKSKPAEVSITIIQSRLGEVLEHSLSRFGRALSASAVDTLSERFGPKLGHSPSGLAMNLGGTQMHFAEANLAAAANTMGMAFAGGGMSGLAGPPMNNASGVDFGQPLAAGHFDERLNMRANSLVDFDRNAIMRSNFEFSTGGSDALGASAGGGGNGMQFAVWGRFDSRSFEAAPTDTITLDASTTIGYVGGDIRIGENQNIVLGVAVSTANGDVEYTQSAVQGITATTLESVLQAFVQEDASIIEENQVEGEIALTMITFYPYVSIDLSDNTTIWGTIGVGSGDAEITSTVDHLIEADTSMTMVALGGRSDLVSLGAMDIAFKADTFIVNTNADDVIERNIENIEAAVQRLRGGLEASRLFPMGGAFMRGSAELAVRMDAGDAENGIGLEVNAGAAYEHTMGIAVEGRVRYLAVHTAEDITELGFSVQGRFDPGGVGGPSIAFAPTWGDMASTADAMWQNDQPMSYGGLLGAPQGQGHDAMPFRMNAELQYAFLTRSWSIAPYSTLAMGSTFGRERFGLRITPLAMTNGNMSLDFFGEQTGGRNTGTVEPGVRATLRLLVH